MFYLLLLPTRSKARRRPHPLTHQKGCLIAPKIWLSTLMSIVEVELDEWQEKQFEPPFAAVLSTPCSLWC